MVKLQTRRLDKGRVPLDQKPDISRNPECYMQIQDFHKNSTVVSRKSSYNELPLPTRSRVESLPRLPSFSTLQKEFDSKKEEALEVFQVICKAVEQNGNKPFFDDTFFLGSRESLYPEGTPQDTTVAEPSVIRRVNEIFPNIPLFSSSSSSSQNDGTDLILGNAGENHIIGAIHSLLVSSSSSSQQNNKKQNPLQHLFIAHDIQKSIFAVMFSAHQTWAWVIVDGTIACKKDGITPLYLRNSSSDVSCQEIYPMILEKALAKFFGSVDVNDGGIAAQTLQTLSGSVRANLDVKKMKWKKDFLKYSPSTQFLQQQNNNNNNIVCCSLRADVPATTTTAAAGANEDNTASSSIVQDEYTGPFGLLKIHNYSILDVREVTDSSSGKCKKGFVKLSNQNYGKSGRWRGEFSTKESWSAKNNASFKKEIISENENVEDPKSFWMAASDWKRLFGNFDVVRVLPSPLEKFQTLTFSSVFQDSPEDIFVLKLGNSLAANNSIQFIIGQQDNRLAPQMFGATRDNHQVAKGIRDLSTRSWQVGIRVNHHINNLSPTSESFPMSMKQELGSLVVSGGEQAYVEISSEQIANQMSKNGGVGFAYLSILPIIDTGTPYYVKVIAPVDAEITMYTLARGVVDEHALGIVDDVTIEQEPDNIEYPVDDDENKNAEEDEDDEGDDDEAWECGLETLKKSELMKMFKSFDFDGSNYLEMSEIQALFMHYTTLSPKAVVTRIRAADTNSDNKISFKEFRAIARDLFSEGKKL